MSQIDIILYVLRQGPWHENLFDKLFLLVYGASILALIALFFAEYIM